MTNIRKSFNFRDGVQVDDDIFIVRGALVGIGTSVPSEKLDVRGTVSISGLLTATNSVLENSLVTGISTANKIFVGITSINSGIITASSTSGIITYFGDGGRLLNLPTSQWLDVDVGLGFTSIYAQGFVGISTFDPRFVFQVGGNADASVSGFRGGVGLSSAGDILATGFVTAYTFVGFGTGITDLNASELTEGTVVNERLPKTISIDNFVGAGISVSVGGTFGNVSISTGIITSTSGIITYFGDGRNLIELNASQITFGTLSNARLPFNIAVGGNISAAEGFFGNLTGNVVGNVIGNLTGIAQTARFLTGTPNISVGIITTTGFVSVGGTIGTRRSVFADEQLITLGSLAAGVGTIAQHFNLGTYLNVGTGITLGSSGLVGIGTVTPLSDVELRKPSNATISVVSDSGQARIAIGRESGVGDQSAVVRFGNDSRTLDIINYDFGNFNFYNHSGSVVGFNTGSFNWIYGKTNENLMRLTYDGKLGIKVENPEHELHVVGTSTITGVAYIGSSLEVDGPITFGTNPRVTLGVSDIDTLVSNFNVNNTTGISTFSQIHITGIGSIGINTSRPVTGLDASRVTGLISNLGIGTLRLTGLNESLTVFGTAAITENVAIGTSRLYNSSTETGGALQIFEGPLKIFDNALIFGGSIGGIGILTDMPDAAIDMSRAKGFFGERTTFLPPVMTTTERNAMSFVPEGGIIYNSSTKKFQGYVGTGWTNFN
jgi:hypothetical protein